MTADLSRRNLLGLMAATPVAAAMPESPPLASGGVMRGSVPRSWIGEMTPETFITRKQVKDSLVLKIDVDTSGLQSAFEEMRELADLRLRNRLPVLSAADDEGPGASGRASGGREPAEARQGAPAPDDHAILKHARAC